MQRLTQRDLSYVLSRCPKDIIKILSDNHGKIFLAGGFIRSVISGMEVKDIDLFGCDKDIIIKEANQLKEERKGTLYKTDNAITILSEGRMPIQFITRWLYNDITDLINSFDFTVCQAAIWLNEDLSGVFRFESLCSDDFYPDLAAKRLCYTSPKREEEVGGSILRAMKFITRGYNLPIDSLSKVITRLMSGISEEALRGNGVPLEQLIEGRLREVDPLTIIDGVEMTII